MATLMDPIEQVLKSSPTGEALLEAPLTSHRSSYKQEPIAVVGLACRLPGNSNSPEELWKFLERDGIADNEAPETRFNLRTHHDGSKKPKTMRSPGGMFLEKIDPRDFDAAFFGISKTDAVAMDPQQRQLLEVVYECLENAGCAMENLDGAAIACFVGSYGVDYADMHARDPDSRPPGVTIGVGRAILSNRISHFFNFNGPSMTIDTACSGSLVGVDVACRYLNTGEADGAVICGANLYLSPEHNMDSGAMKGASSLTGRCWTFDARADGYIKAEGINAVYLKRLSDAVRDNDPIRGVIRGTATNSDGRTPGIASPSSEAQARAIRAAYANAGLSDLTQTNYLECHGTGTPAGDPQEVQGAASVFSGTRDAQNPLIIGSIKSNLGHSEPAAGVSGLIKAVLATEKGIIPGNPTFEKPNPKIDFHNLKVRATRTTIPWPNAPFRRASVNSFGYGGSNAHAVIEEAKVLVPAEKIRHVSSYASTKNLFDDSDDEDGFPAVVSPPRLLTVSANNDTSLKAYVKSLRKHLLNPNVKVSLTDLAYTLNERRSQHFNRGFSIARSTDFDDNDFVFGKKNPEPPKIGFVFTGQGAQWSQMGKELVDTFPKAELILKHLDDVLQALPKPPSWSLLKELTEPRKPELLRVPEFSQPLVTALQIAMFSVIQDWGINATAVVGHSSGEIAAAWAAGRLSKEDAIRAAFYRGQAARERLDASEAESVGMLAVGLGSEQVAAYLNSCGDSVQIACYNSPSSVTLSGTTKALNEVKDHLTADKHFARMLQVNLAYHSSYMSEIGAIYKRMLEEDFEYITEPTSDIAMFSSVTGDKQEGPNDVQYWVNNMTSAVKFDSAARSMLTSDYGINFLVEVGPSGALAGPLSQIMKGLEGQASKAQYVPALKRGQGSVLSMFDVVGKLYLAGAEIDFAKVNAAETGRSVIVDLPNYSWDHSIKYWYENESSKDWRYRLFGHHDLLGSKILGTTWRSPSWKKTLHLNDVSWLKDHKMGKDVVFPAAGFMAMGIEAVRQKYQALATLEGALAIEKPAFRLRNVKFPKALVLEEGDEGARIMLSLAALPGANDAWHSFQVYSLRDDTWSEHCRGLVRIDEDTTHATPERVKVPIEDSVPGNLWYKAMNDAGYNFGPMFQPQLEVESTLGQHESRSIVSLAPPTTEVQQSEYPLHPTALDGCLQTCAPSLWAGNRSGVNAVLIPAIIDNLLITSSAPVTSRGISLSSAKYNNLGRADQTKNYISDAAVYDTDSGNLVFKLSGLRYHKLDTAETPYDKHKYSRLLWRPDVSHLTNSDFVALSDSGELGEDGLSIAQSLVDLSAHKKPNLRVLEINMIADDTDSIWLEGSAEDHSIRDPCSKFVYVHLDATAFLEVQDKYDNPAEAEFLYADITHDKSAVNVEAAPFDLAIYRSSKALSQDTETYLRTLLAGNGHLLVLQQHISKEHTNGAANGNGVANGHTNGVNGLNGTADHTATSEAVNGLNGHSNGVANGHSNGVTNGHSNGVTNGHSNGVIYSEYTDGSKIQLNDASDYTKSSVVAGKTMNSFASVGSMSFSSADSYSYVALLKAKQAEDAPLPPLDVVSFGKLSTEATKVLAKLEITGWEIRRCGLDFTLTRPGSIILVLDELVSSVFPNMLEEHWAAIQSLLTLGHRVLWTTSGAQYKVNDPDKAMINGLGRTVRNEDPSISLTTLDVSSASGPAAAVSVEKVLRTLIDKAPSTRVENEFVERNGVVHVCRVIPDHLINQRVETDTKGAEPVAQDLHTHPNTVRMRCERLGNIDALCFAEVDTQELPLLENRVEVEIAAAGLNFKDVAVTMGIVPENEYLLGLEGAGTIRRVHPSVRGYHVGQRVLVFEKGTFANRIIATTERVHPIPDMMTFEEASTLASVYLTALYSIYDLAGTKAGDRVLIHSASGGLGIASIQICQQLGAEVFVTVGTAEKRQFLRNNFGIADGHIFNSRTTEFGPALMEATEGYGVDVVLNSLTGDLLDESWRCVANGGTMVELGKKDMLDRNTLSMEPFSRNASYRCFDMSHKHVSDTVIARLLKQLFNLIDQGIVKPIAPIQTFGFDEIQSAFRFMRGANHIGKIVVTMGEKSEINVPIRSAPRPLEFNQNGSILIIGGLKGLCGSLALYLARFGAKNFVILGRSGYDDSRSQNCIRNLRALGCHVDLIKGDVASLEDVRRTFKSATVPISGIIQGAMVLRDKVFTSMTIQDYHTVIQCKVAGSWNIHNVAIEEGIELDFFTMLSSISGLTGQKGQANYAAANVFLDNFAVYRRQLGLAANSVDLGAIEDVGYMSQHSDLLVALDSSAWTPINEALFHKIVRYSLFQQGSEPINPASTQLVTSLAVPQSDTSKLLFDARFGPLCFGAVSSANSGASAAAKELNAFLLMVKAPTNMSAVVEAGASLVNNQFVNILRLPEPMEPAKPLSAYGLDSLAAVEFRNWVRSDLNIELTTLEITNAANVLALSEKIVEKLTASVTKSD